jgi:drug/metabolite transporter (DMT)-like permease
VGVVFVLLSATGFAAKAIFVKLAYRHGVDALTLLALRMLFAQLFLILFWLGRRIGAATRPPTEPARAELARADVLRLGALGLLGYYAASQLDFMGLVYISAALERLILFLYPTLVVLISAVAFRRPIDRVTALSLGLGYLGIALVLAEDLGAPQRDVWLGVGLVFVSTVTYSLYLVGSGQMVRRLGALRVSDFVLTVSASAVVLQFALTHPLGRLVQPKPVLAYAAVMGLVSTVLPIYLLAAGMAKIGASRASLLSSIGPVITIALGVIVLGERLAAIEIVGAALVIAGVTLVARPKA